MITNKYQLGDNCLLGVENIAKAMKLLEIKKSSLGLFTKLETLNDNTIVETVENIDKNGFTKLMSAFQNLQSKKINETKELAKHLKQEYPKCSEVYRLLSFIADYEKDYKSAMENIEKAIECNKENTFAWLQKGRLLFDELNKPDDAVLCFCECVKIDKYMFHAYHDLGLVCMKFLNDLINSKNNNDIKKYASDYTQNAFDFFQMSASINPLFLDNYPNIAQILLIGGDYESCIMFINESMDFFKRHGLYDINNDVIRFLKIIYEDAQNNKYRLNGQNET